MISVCSVTIAQDHEQKNNSVFEPMFIESILNRLPLVSEIVICNVSAREDFYREINVKGRRIVNIGYKSNFFHKNEYSTNDFKLLHLGHPLGMKHAIENATNDFVLLCDTDIFFYTAVDELYHNLMIKYNLSYIGACPHGSILYSCKYFPNILCMLTNKKHLPNNEFLYGEFIVQDIICGRSGDCKILSSEYPSVPEFLHGEYLLGRKIDAVAAEFPNPEGLFDTGVYLYLWAKRNNLNWLGFQPSDIHMYTSQIYRSNLKIKDRLPIQKLFFHATGGSRRLYLNKFIEEYKKQ